MESIENYEAMLKVAGDFHGDICAGIRIGTRMAICGLQQIGISNPKGADRKKMIVFAEIDRCTTDAIMAITGCRPGKRSMKIYDYGKMAATFHNLETGRTVRVGMKGKPTNQPQSEMPDFARVKDEEIFNIQNVTVHLRPEDLPGKPLRRVQCVRCGANVMDGREVEVGGEPLCKPCASGQNYYEESLPPDAVSSLS